MDLSNAPGVRRLMSNEDIRDLIEAARAAERARIASFVQAYMTSDDGGWDFNAANERGGGDDLIAAILARGKTGEAGD